MNIQVTPTALSELQTALEREQCGYIRITVIPGGCSGFKYSMNLEESTGEDDMVVDVSGFVGISWKQVKLLVDPFSSQYLEGLHLDYVSTMEASGFKFNNPNATGGCGCGSSFSA